MRYEDKQFKRALRDRPGSTALGVADLVGCSVRTARRRLAALEGRGLARRVRHGRAYLWVATAQPETRRQSLTELAQQARDERADEFEVPHFEPMTVPEVSPAILRLRALAEQGRALRAVEYRAAA